jgi:uncharacterized membrane protein
VDAFMNSPFAHVSLGAGLAVLCGLRAFLPVAILGLFARLGWLASPVLKGTSFAFLQSSWLIGLLFALSLVEIVLDKAPALDRAPDVVAIPLRILAGAVVFGAALAPERMPAVIIGLVAGGLIAGVSHAAKSVIRPGAVATAGAAHPYLSLMEDVAAAIGAVLVLLLPLLGIVLVAALLFFVYRILRRRRRKYKGLRILKD